MSEPIQIKPALESPLGLLAELTHVCPLGCAYCSNPIELVARAQELDTAAWMRIFSQAAKLGVLQVHLSGGEPAARRDLAEIVAHCAGLSLYTNLITSGVGLTEAASRACRQPASTMCNCRSRIARRTSADRIAGYKGAYAKKMQVARWVVDCGHSADRSMRSSTAPMSNARSAWCGWRWRSARGASKSRIRNITAGASRTAQQLMPSREDADAAWTAVEALRAEVERQNRHRPCRARLSRAHAEALHGRLGPAHAERLAHRQGAALSCRRKRAWTGILERAATIRSATSGRSRRPSTPIAEPIG